MPMRSHHATLQPWRQRSTSSSDCAASSRAWLANAREVRSLLAASSRHSATTVAARLSTSRHHHPLQNRIIPVIEHVMNMDANIRPFPCLTRDRLSRSKSAFQSKFQPRVGRTFRNFGDPSQIMRGTNWPHRRRGAPPSLPLPEETGTNGKCNFCHLHPNFPGISVEGERRASQPLNPPPSPSIGAASPHMVIPGGMSGAMFDFQPLETCK